MSTKQSRLTSVGDVNRNRDRDNDNKSANGIPSSVLKKVRPVKEVNDSEPYTLFFDGGSRGNGTSHAVAGCGFIIYDDKGKEFTNGSMPMGIATNNEAEYNGLLLGIAEARKKGLKKLVVKGDSQLVIRQMTGEYQVKNHQLKLLHDQITRMCKGFEAVSFMHVERALNGAADKLANKAMDEYERRHYKK